MNSLDNEFLKSYYSSDITRIRNYLLSQGKKPKPVSPFIYIKKEKQDEIGHITSDENTDISINR